MGLLKKILRKIFHHSILDTLRNYRILTLDYGQFKSMVRWSCVDKDDNELPWYSYPAIEYIEQLDFTDKNVLEYGSGNSSIFWAKRCKKLVSVESDSEWYFKIKDQLPDNVDYHLVEGKDEYVSKIHEYPFSFDIIVVDGLYRYDCAVEALKKLNQGGIIILDNSDWWPETSKFLRNTNLIEVDMNGFGPINSYTWTTSFYISRDVQLKPANDRCPYYGRGNLLDINKERLV